MRFVSGPFADGNPEQYDLEKVVGVKVDADEELAFCFRRTQELKVTGTPAEMAKILGVSMAALRKYMDEGDDTFMEKVDDTKFDKLSRRKDTEVDHEEYEFMDLDVA